jgi:hypothetical protein
MSGGAFIQNSKFETDVADLNAIPIAQLHAVNAVVIDEGPGGAAGVPQCESVLASRGGAGIDGLDLKSTVASGNVEVVEDEIALAAAADRDARHTFREDQRPTSILSRFDLRDCYLSSWCATNLVGRPHRLCGVRFPCRSQRGTNCGDKVGQPDVASAALPSRQVRTLNDSETDRRARSVDERWHQHASIDRRCCLGSYPIGPDRSG